MGAAGRRHRHVRSACLGDGGDLPHRAAAAGSFRHRGRDRADDGRRHRRRQGRLPESRPDGLRQPLRDGLLLRRGLHRLDPGAAGHRRRRTMSRWLRSASPLPSLTADQQAAATAAMQRALQGIDLTKTEVVLSPPVGGRHRYGARRSCQVAQHRQSRRPAGRRPTASTRSSRVRRRISWCSLH